MVVTAGGAGLQRLLCILGLVQKRFIRTCGLGWDYSTGSGNKGGGRMENHNNPFFIIKGLTYSCKYCMKQRSGLFRKLHSHERDVNLRWMLHTRRHCCNKHVSELCEEIILVLLFGRSVFSTSCFGLYLCFRAMTAVSAEVEPQ